MGGRHDTRSDVHSGAARTKVPRSPRAVGAASPATPPRTSRRTGHRPAELGRAKPFVKWVGGKRQLLAEIHRHVPETYGAYHEPFVGGGAVFFSLSPPGEVFLSDSNERLVRCYKGIKKDAKAVIAELKTFRRGRDFFEEMRRRDIDRASDVEVAAWFIFLNKTGFNGLYRVNRNNRFNVPFGDGTHRQLFDEKNLLACQRALTSATIECQDFRQAARRALPGDFVYFDPPYIPLSPTSSFTSYTARGFTDADQCALRDLALDLKSRGVHVLVSNSSPAAKLYGRPFSTTRVLATRQVNRNADGRGKIAELLIK
jgi:DNA adenine methylase